MISFVSGELIVRAVRSAKCAAKAPDDQLVQDVGHRAEQIEQSVGPVGVSRRRPRARRRRVVRRGRDGAAPRGGLCPGSYESRGLRLVGTLLCTPLWWVGTVGDSVGYVAQAAGVWAGLAAAASLPLPSPRWRGCCRCSRGGRAARRGRRTWGGPPALIVALGDFVVVGEPRRGWTGRRGKRRPPSCCCRPRGRRGGLRRSPRPPAAAPRGRCCSVSSPGSPMARSRRSPEGESSTRWARAVLGAADDVGDLRLAGAAVGGTLAQQSAFQAVLGLQASLLVITGWRAGRGRPPGTVRAGRAGAVLTASSGC